MYRANWIAGKVKLHYAVGNNLGLSYDQVTTCIDCAKTLACVVRRRPSDIGFVESERRVRNMEVDECAAASDDRLLGRQRLPVLAKFNHSVPHLPELLAHPAVAVAGEVSTFIRMGIGALPIFG